MKFRGSRWLVLLGLVGHLASAQSQSVSYSLLSLGGSSWEYDYTIASSSPSLSFDEITIYFGADTATGLSLAASPAGWSPVVIQSDASIPADGYLDVVSPTGPLANASSVCGFAVDFTYLATGAPGAQTFQLYNSADFTLQYSGVTTAAATTVPAVPEPSSFALFLGGIGALWSAKRRRQQASSPCA